MLRVQVRMLIASELPALHRFNSSLLESYVEVSQEYLPLHPGPQHVVHISVLSQTGKVALGDL